MQGYATSLGKPRVNITPHLSTIAVLSAIFLVLTLFNTHAMQAQTFSVLHNFTGGADGGNPFAGVTVGPAGVLYGTADGGTGDAGTVFRLSPHGSSFIFSPLYEFTGGSDGSGPGGGVVIGPNGALYGTTTYGGGDDYGTVFELRPPPTFCRAILCYWNETVLYDFGPPPDGRYPGGFENLAFDQAGNIYGTTLGGGMYVGGGNNGGTTFELTPSGGGYTESIIHSFGSGTDGVGPYAGVVLDTAGNVYGTTPNGGTDGGGAVYQLMPSNGGWLENVLVNFNGTNGSEPYGNLIIDGSGNLYGSASGVVFKLAPSVGGFTYSILYHLSGDSVGGLAMDTAGNLFGVSVIGGSHNDGWIFELTNCSQTCSVVDLHDFSGSDGWYPNGTPVLDANGNLYGTTAYGGPGTCGIYGNGCGVVWEIAGVGSPRR